MVPSYGTFQLAARLIGFAYCTGPIAPGLSHRAYCIGHETGTLSV